MRSLIPVLLSLFALAVVCAADQAAPGPRVDVVARLLQAEDALRYEPFLGEVLLDATASPRERQLAARAIGHLGDLRGVEPLLRAATADRPDRAAACRALGWLWLNSPERPLRREPPAAVLATLLERAKSDPEMTVRTAAFEALALAFPGEGQDLAATAAQQLANIPFDNNSAELFCALIRVAATAGKPEFRTPIFTLALTQKHWPVAYMAAYYAGRSAVRELPLTSALVAALDRPNAFVRAAALRSITNRENDAPAGVVDKAKSLLANGSTQEKIAAANALVKFLPAAESLPLMATALDQAGTARATTVHQAILEALATKAEPAVAEFLWDRGLRKVPYWRMARVAAARAGAKAQVLAEPIDRYVADDEYAVFYVDLLAAAGAVDKLAWLAAGEGVSEIFGRSLIVRQAVIINLVYASGDQPSGEAIEGHEHWLKDADPIIRSAALSALGANRKHDWVNALRSAWKKAESDRLPDAAVAVFEALESLAKDNPQPAYRALLIELAKKGVADPRLAVRRKAVAVLFEMTGETHVAALYGVDTGRSLADYTIIAKRVVEEFSTRFILETNKGDIPFEISHAAAPLAADNFLRLTGAGFYDGLRFHRVVPGFVVQGGDPQGLGWGGPGYSIRDEEGGMPFHQGMIGMASAGHDTAGSQFFFTVLPTPHLDGLYTAFGFTKHIETLESLVPGDRILSIKIQP